MKRLQGHEMSSMRSKLRFISYSESNKGNIRVNLALKDEDKVRYYHWLNDEEKTKFKNSEFYNVKYKSSEGGLKLWRKHINKKQEKNMYVQNVAEQ